MAKSLVYITDWQMLPDGVSTVSQFSSVSRFGEPLKIVSGTYDVTYRDPRSSYSHGETVRNQTVRVIRRLNYPPLPEMVLTLALTDTWERPCRLP